MGISGTQGQDAACPEVALNCKAICACWHEKKNLNTHQTKRWNRECHMCKAPHFITPMMKAPTSQTISKEDAETLDTDEEN